MGNAQRIQVLEKMAADVRQIASQFGVGIRSKVCKGILAGYIAAQYAAGNNDPAFFMVSVRGLDVTELERITKSLK